MPIDLGLQFQNYKHFLKYFAFYLWTAVYSKNSTWDCCLFIYLQSYNDKRKFSFLQTVQPSRNTSYLRTSRFCAKYNFSSSNILLYIEKNPVEKLCKALEMELKKYIPVDQNSFSRKPNWKFCINSAWFHSLTLMA